MPPRRKPLVMPLPRSWLPRPTWTGEEQSARDAALVGMVPNPGTKDYFKMLLSAAGWDVQIDSLDLVKQRLTDVLVETDKRNLDLGAVATKLRKAGMKVDLVKKPKQRSSAWLQEVWKSLTLHPWWAASAQGQKSLVLLGKTTTVVESASALFLHDVWTNLGQSPTHRMPVFRRASLVSLMSPEAMNHFFETKGRNTDILVVHGGFLDADTMYQTFSYLSAVHSMFNGFLLYEAVPPKGVDIEMLADTAKRSGFASVIGVV